MSQSLSSYLFISSALFAIGVFGLLARKNLIALLISLELILNSASINFVAFNRFCLTNKSTGQVFAIFIIALAAAEVCIGLSLVLAVFKNQNSINVEQANQLKG